MIKSRHRRSAAAIALATVLTALTSGCAGAPPPPPSQEETMRQAELDIAHRYLIADLVKCLDKPLDAAQRDYLLHATHHAAQHYLLTVGKAECVNRALSSCETFAPGKCLAPKEQ